MDEIVHPGHNHPLSLCSNVGFTSSDKENAKCYGCNCSLINKRNPFHTYLYECRTQGCKYFLDLHCANLKNLSETIHPLHPQHPITPHFQNDHEIREFVCSFCQETKTSGFFYHCNECDFYLDIVCSLYFERNPVLLRKYEFEFLDGFHTHRLCPHVIPETSDHTIKCEGCKMEIPYGATAFKCIASSCSGCSLLALMYARVGPPLPFYIHPHCARKTKERIFPFHRHPLTTLLQMPPDAESKRLQCFACCRRIDNVFLLHCAECSFHFDPQCVLREPAVKYQRHDHSLVHFAKIYLDGVRCSLCNILCDQDLYRCSACNFNIHPRCLLKPFRVFCEHVHSLVLRTRLEGEEYYICDICEKERDPDAGVYWCDNEGCSFAAHIDCAVSESTEVLEPSSPQILDWKVAESLKKLMVKD